MYNINTVATSFNIFVDCELNEINQMIQIANINLSKNKDRLGGSESPNKQQKRVRRASDNVAIYS